MEPITTLVEIFKTITEAKLTEFVTPQEIIKYIYYNEFSDRYKFDLENKTSTPFKDFFNYFVSKDRTIQYFKTSSDLSKLIILMKETFSKYYDSIFADNNFKIFIKNKIYFDGTRFELQISFQEEILSTNFKIIQKDKENILKELLFGEKDSFQNKIYYNTRLELLSDVYEAWKKIFIKRNPCLTAPSIILYG